MAIRKELDEICMAEVFDIVSLAKKSSDIAAVVDFCLVVRDVGNGIWIHHFGAPGKNAIGIKVGCAVVVSLNMRLNFFMKELVFRPMHRWCRNRGVKCKCHLILRSVVATR